MKNASRYQLHCHILGIRVTGSSSFRFSSSNNPREIAVQMKPIWNRLIRFVATDGRTLRGEPILPDEMFDLGFTIKETKLQARVITGRDIFDTTGSTKLTDEIVTVERLLCPLDQQEVPIIRCIGLNYATHIRETGRTPPPYPFYFLKPNTTILDHDANVVIPKIAQDGQADYEGELCLVLGKDAKDVLRDDAQDYIGAWTVGNDISARKLQVRPELAGPTPQFCFSKGFDTFAPMGPCLVSNDVIGQPSDLHLTTKVNGDIRQSKGVSDLLFDCGYLIEYLSQGTTLQKGSVIMTGTPGGVGNGMKPPRYLIPGDVMEVMVSKIGTLRNGVEFA